jgi:chemotaxis protein MotA
MNIAAVAGVISVFTCVILAIVIPGGNLTLFINIEAIFIVILGGFSCIIAGYPIDVTMKIPKYFKVIFRKFKIDYIDLIHTIITLAESSRKEGLLSLEDKVEDVANPLLKRGLQMAIDGVDEEMIKKSLNADIEQMAKRHNLIIDLYETWANLSPSFGMVGTLAGLILMLGNLSDIDAVGPGMSAALTTTFYGALMGYGVFTPFSKHLEALHEKEELGQEIIVEGVLSIVHGESTRLLEDKLVSFLPPAMRGKIISNTN